MMKIDLEKIKPYITLTNIIYSILLAFSCYMLINYLTDMVDGSDVERGIGLFAICLDLGAQYVFITALTEWSRGKWKKGLYKYRITAIILIFIFGLYETCFAVPSSISFFLVQVDKKEKANQAVITQVTDNRDKLQDIKDELAALNVGLMAEAKTTIRQNGQSILDRKKELQKQRDEIEKGNSQNAQIIDKIASSAVNSFDVTAENFGIPKQRAKVLTFGIAIFLLRVLMILFCIKIKGERAALTALNETKSKSGQKPGTNETLSDTGKEALSRSTSLADSSWSGEMEKETKNDTESKMDETLVNTEKEVLSRNTSLADSSWSFEVEKETKTDTELKTNETLINTEKEVLSRSTSPANSSLDDSPGSEPKVLKNEFIRFTEALFNDTRKLNGDPVVSQKTGIPLERCTRYRQVLSSLRIGDKTAIFKTQGGSVSNYPKADLLEYLQTNAPEII
jgi:hypothetical protein